MARPRPLGFFAQFFRAEASGGLVLLAAAAAALVIANSPFAGTYRQVLALPLGPLTALGWVNDGLMAVFFFVVGLEVKRELLDGQLSTGRARVLPVLAAAGGMAAPALVYLALAGPAGFGRGWAIPAATDIAFALGVLALLGDRVPASLKLFLTAVAVVDDMGAVAIIALFYTSALNLAWLGAATAILGGLLLANRLGVLARVVYVLGALGLWWATHESGVHATVAGVLAAFAVPLGRGKRTSPLYRLERALHPWTSFLVVPVFGFANAGVDLRGLSPEALAAPLPLAVLLGLFAGKQVGIFMALRGAALLGFAPPAGASWRQLYGVALLCGIGFTMSLFIGALAFADAALQAQVKLGVLAGSLLSALAGWLVLRTSPAARSRAAPARS